MAFILFFLDIPRKFGELDFKNLIFELDFPGTALCVGAITCLLLGFTWGGSQYAWTNARVLSLLILGGLFAIGFVVDQVLLGDYATISKRLILNRNVLGCCLFVCCLGAAQFVLIYYVSF
jgi:hypothetical protein